MFQYFNSKWKKPVIIECTFIMNRGLLALNLLT